MRLQSLHWRTVATRRLSCSALDLSVVILSWVTAAQLLQLGVDTVVPRNDVRVLGVILSSELTMSSDLSPMSARLVLLDAATATCAAVTGLEISGYTRPSMPSLFPTSIKRTTGWGTEGYDRQVTASFKCGCSSCQ